MSARVFAAVARCRCGAGLSRPAKDPAAEWECSALEQGLPGLHDTLDPMMTWEPDETPRQTTRPAGVLPLRLRSAA